MVENPLVSVIVPVYNVEQYLRQCVHSIIAQSYNNIEIILVDDGSTDASGAICDEICREEKRIRVFHIENGGPGKARNFGVNKSRGQWILFVDSDDFISPAYVHILLNAALLMGCDMSIVPFGTAFTSEKQVHLEDDSERVAPAIVLTQRQAEEGLLYQKYDTAPQWRICKRSLFDKIVFPENLYYEDLATIYKLVHECDSVALVNTTHLYAYRMSQNSIMRGKYNHQKCESALVISESLYSEIVKWYPSLREAAASRIFSLCRMVFGQIPSGKAAVDGVYTRDRSALWHVLRRYRHVVVWDRHARRRERLAAIIACCGEHAFSLFCRLCRRLGWMQ